MKINEDGSIELTEGETVVKEWHESLLDVGHSHGAASEQILLRTPTNGKAWEILGNDDFRKYLYGIRMWGPLAKDDHKPSDEPLPRIEFLDDEGSPQYEAEVRRIGQDLFVVKSPDGMEYMVTRQEVETDDYLRFKSCEASYQTGGTEEYGTTCDRNIDHPAPHEGPCPFGTEQRVRWEGGGTAGGDRLPFRNVEFIDPK